MFRNIFFKKFILPGLIFQSLVIGGGYGTGRELVEFFLLLGPKSGLYGMIISLIIWCIVLSFTFDLSRKFQTYDYRSFLKKLLGKGWVFYEITYLIGLVLVISVLASASGNLLNEALNISNIYGIILMILLIGIFSYFGSKVVMKFLSYWSIALYFVFLILIISIGSIFSENIILNFNISENKPNWLINGFKYAAYNVGIVPAMLFCLKDLKTRKEAIVSGIIGAFLAMIPGFMIYFSLLSHYPEIKSEIIPINFLFNKLGSDSFKILFQIILFGTFVETGLGLIHGFNERIASWLMEKKIILSGIYRFIISSFIMVICIFFAEQFGLISLIAEGYGTLTWAYWIIFVFPVIFIGLKKLF
tara:strand:- start:204 stop:1283 length:1080 start_codon:yes stop_codon:yes gene_type:complete